MTLAFVERWRQSLSRWFESHAGQRGARAWLFLYSAVETICIPFPADVFMIAILLQNTKKWRELAFITTLGSILGALIGYAIGYYAFEAIGKVLVEFAGLQAGFEFAQRFIESQGFWVIFAAALTPLPNVVVAAGFFKMNFFMYLLAWILGRGLRFYGVAYVVHAYGSQGLSQFHRYGSIAAIIFGFLFATVLAAALFGIWKL